MTNSFINQLRETTQNAKRCEQEEAERKAQHKIEVERRKHEAEDLKARQIIETIEGKCREAAQKGHNRIDVMKLGYSDFVHEKNVWSVLYTLSNMKRVPEIVTQAIREMGLTVKLRDEHDGVGVESWWILEASW